MTPEQRREQADTDIAITHDELAAKSQLYFREVTEPVEESQAPPATDEFDGYDVYYKRKFLSGLSPVIARAKREAVEPLSLAADGLAEAITDIESKIVDFEAGRINWRPDDFLFRVRAARAVYEKAKGGK